MATKTEARPNTKLFAIETLNQEDGGPAFQLTVDIETFDEAQGVAEGIASRVAKDPLFTKLLITSIVENSTAMMQFAMGLAEIRGFMASLKYKEGESAANEMLAKVFQDLVGNKGFPKA